MNLRKQTPSPILLLSIALLSGVSCSTQKFAIEPLQIITRENRKPAQKEPTGDKSDNGGPRGGGDIVAGEFMEYERIALARMEVWSKQGKIPITEDQLVKIRALMPPNQGKNPKHTVTSEDHVCITEGKLPDGNCLKKEDERDVIKQPFAKPPRIFVGRIRWNDPSNTPARKEAMAGHELRGLALSVPGKPFADESFDKTYQALNAAIAEWNAVVRTHLDFLRKMRLYDEMHELLDFTIFQAVKETFVESSADYLRCVKASDAEVKEIDKIQDAVVKDAKKKRKSQDLYGGLKAIQDARRELEGSDVKQACNRALEGLQVALQKNATPKIQEKANQISDKVRGVANEWEKWARTVQPGSWQNWLYKSMNNFIEYRQEVLNRSKDIPSNTESNFNTIVDKKCPRKSMKDFRETTTCNIDEGTLVVADLFKTHMIQVVDGLIGVHEKIVVEVASQVDPI